MRVWINFCLCQGLVAISQRKWELMQPFKSHDTAIVLSKRHGEHAGHQNLHAAQTTGNMFWRCLVDDNGVCATLEIVADEILKIVSEIHVFRGMLVESVKCFLERLL